MTCYTILRTDRTVYCRYVNWGSQPLLPPGNRSKKCQTTLYSSPGPKTSFETRNILPLLSRLKTETPGTFIPFFFSYPMSTENGVPLLDSILNFQPRPVANFCWTEGGSGETTAKAALSSRCGNTPLKPSAHIVQ